MTLSELCEALKKGHDSVRVINAAWGLKESNPVDRQVSDVDWNEVRRRHNCGIKSQVEIAMALERLGVSFKGVPPNVSQKKQRVIPIAVCRLVVGELELAARVLEMNGTTSPTSAERLREAALLLDGKKKLSTETTNVDAWSTTLRDAITDAPNPEK